VHLRSRVTATAVVCALATAACSTAPTDRTASVPAAFASDRAYAPSIEPANFVGEVDNRYFPLPVGARWTYEGGGEAAGEADMVEVLDETRVVMGVDCTVVRDEVSLDGEPIEITFDWYAQDVDGNVWYFGEESAEYENGEIVSTAGSWEAGVDGAQPGIIMPANPVIGVTYRQEFYPGEAEDLAKAVETDATVAVEAGRYQDVLVTEDWTPLEPDVAERKSYAPGVGLVKEETIRGGDATFELVDVNGN
jgi:hypothetical protein